MNLLPPESRFTGCLLGLATGDALGITLEFQPPGTFRPLRDMAGGGPFGLKPGQWTDDTSLALCLTESGGFDPRDRMERYLRWWREGHLSSNGRCFDIGNTTPRVLMKFRETGDPRLAGNGSLMRFVPVPMFYAADPERAIHLAGGSSRTTHGARACVDACRYLAALMVGALNGADKLELLSERYSPVPGCWHAHTLGEEIDEIARGSFKQKNPPAIAGKGYIVPALEVALWCGPSTIPTVSSRAA